MRANTGVGVAHTLAFTFSLQPSYSSHTGCIRPNSLTSFHVDKKKKKKNPDDHDYGEELLTQNKQHFIFEVH